MNKKERKQFIKEIDESIDNLKSKIEEINEPINRIKELIREAIEIAEENQLELDIDEEAIEGDLLGNAITDSDEYSNIEEKIDEYIAELEEWADNVTETKADDINEKYISPMEELKDELDTDWVDCETDFEEFINNLKTSISTIEV